MGKLTGKTALITGALQGIGEGIARTFARHGANLILLDISPEIEKLADELCDRGHRCTAVVADVRDPASVAAAIKRAKEKEGRIDILVNNAGLIRREDALEFSEKDWDDVMNLNIKSVFFMSQAAAKHFIAQGNGGKIINIASMLSFQGGIRVPSYTASKSGVMGVTRLMANEWAKHNINVNAIAPGYMATNNTQQLRA
ncbi:SDR family NAD(P)-dependent oxidoreductase, partial [Escherichia coli]|nr:SDR family NAD(P)-dependent oxidoreductase [Escherichia coli]